jgi:hypothetical protein
VCALRACRRVRVCTRATPITVLCAAGADAHRERHQTDQGAQGRQGACFAYVTKLCHNISRAQDLENWLRNELSKEVEMRTASELLLGE